MARLTVVLPRSNTTKQFRIASSLGQLRVMSYAPRTAKFTDTARIGSISRPGKKPITRGAGISAKTLQFEQTVASVDWHGNVISDLAWLRKQAAGGYRVKFRGLSELESSVWWYIEKLDISIEQRNPRNQVSRARLSWSLIEANDVAVNAGKAVPAAPKKKVAKAKPKAVARTYRVVRGDTLWHISRRFLGKATRWPEIFKLNRGSGKNQIRNPNLIYPGQVFKLPPK